MEKVEKRAFQKGWMQVPQGLAATVRAKITFALGITTKQAFRDRLNGRVSHSDADIWAIEKIFNEIGITEIWGNVNESFLITKEITI
jgi:glycyl-tRNA synthetase (class II)